MRESRKEKHDARDKRRRRMVHVSSQLCSFRYSLGGAHAAKNIVCSEENAREQRATKGRCAKS